MTLTSPRTETGRSLLSHPEFRLFWAGESVSLVGSAVTYVAFPLVAVLTLHASPLEIGVLAMAGKLPPLVFGAFVGVVVDSLPRRTLMIWSDLGRMALLASVPVAAAAGVLTIGQLILVSFVIGSLSLVFNVAYQAFLPSVVHRDQLAEGNGKLAASQSVAEVTGPGVAGWMMALAGPAGALLVDAASFGVSALALRALRVEEQHRPRRGKAPFWSATRSGFIALWADPVLRSVTVSTSIVVAFSQIQMAVYFLFLVKELHFGSGTIGVLFSVSGVFGFMGAVFSDRISRRIGVGALIVAGQATQAAGGLLLAVAGGSRLLAGAVILAGEVCFAVGLSVFSVSYVSLRQARIDDEVRGRVVGASRFVTTAL
ncbi:MAG: MFS transporter, partial [Actinobacteria bacterium]|nr:MFS transporter [Actinomycetota bacterium]